MIASVRGPVVDVALDHVVIEASGVGYRLNATPATLSSLQRGDDARLVSRHTCAVQRLLARLADDHAFVDRVRGAKDDLDRYLREDRWYQGWAREQEDGAPAAIAYFSPEYGITEVLPQYSGGLGILAGDHLKAASDLGVPIVGVGLFYTTGYFKQSLDASGWQQETYPVLDPQGLPLHLLREDDGTPCVVTVAMPGGASLRAHVWRAQVGRVPLLLLDSDVPGNDDAMRAVTERLYGGGGEQRLQQEMLLGIGGVRALRLWSRLTGAPAPEVFHTNEGHAGFLGIERISEFTQGAGLSFEEAMEAARAGTIFTTHTPVPAGIDRFDVALLERYFGGAQELPGVPLDKLRALGAETYEGGSEGIFNMAVMGLRLAERANGVSQLHGVVSREMFDGLWPGFDDAEVPITSITNGVHAPTWMSPQVLELAEREGDETAAALAPFLSATPLDNMPDATFDDANVREGLAGSGISCPPIDGALLRRYFEWFIDCGYLPAPSSLDLPESAAS